MDDLISPHGGKLVELMASSERAAEIQAESRDWASWDLSERQICDLELLLNGGFSPLPGFLGRRDHETVCSSMRLGSGHLWPIPVVLDLPETAVKGLAGRSMLALRDPEGVMLAALRVEEVWQPDRMAEAQAVYGTTSREHPGVAYLLGRTHPLYVSGRLEGLRLPAHYDFRHLRLTPSELRSEFSRRGWRRIVAFQTRNPMHRAHFELTRRAAEEAQAKLLLHPSVGMTKPGDLDHYTRGRCYQALLGHYPPDSVRLSLLPLAMRMGGPREVLWHAIIRKNFGCTHFIVGRDHAGPGADSSGRPFYGPYAAQEALAAHQGELGIGMVPFRNMVYAQDLDQYVPEEEASGRRVLSISGTELRRRLAEGREVPAWFTFPEVTRELLRSHPPRREQGFTVFFTGLSGAGKSTVANVLLGRLLEIGGRPVTLLDGDVVRKHLSSELGFSREHRNLNIHRIGFVASEITKNGGIAICAPIAPYEDVRQSVRQAIQAVGGFVLVHVATPLEVCEARDRKGMYAKARAGIIKEFTGISDPYEAPPKPELVLDTSFSDPGESAERILSYLREEGWLSDPARREGTAGADEPVGLGSEARGLAPAVSGPAASLPPVGAAAGP